jgi:hypothetical protein
VPSGQVTAAAASREQLVIGGGSGASRVEELGNHAMNQAEMVQVFQGQRSTIKAETQSTI